MQIPPLFGLGYRHRFVWSPKHAGVKEVGRLMAPRTLGLAISQIDTTVDLMLATILGARMVTIFNFAQHLQQLPVGLFGATIAQAAFPSLSLASASEHKEQFKMSILSAIHQVLFFVLPVSALFVVLRIPIVRLVFGSNRFDWEATVLTGVTLSAFSISLFAQALVHVLARGFYALYDSRTPVAIGVVAIAVNTIASIVFIQVLHLPVWSLGLSTSLASIINFVLLFIALDRRVSSFPRKALLVPPIKMLIAVSITGIMLYVPLKLLDQLVFDTTRTINLLFLTGITGTIGLSTYVFLSWVFGVGEVQSFLKLIQKVSRARRILLEPAGEVVNGGIQDKLS
ncbi:oligosaccharide flippase family protein [Candidatus Gottesmanbacteria bacterium]|nr:oligosaccharide flippase family protein [Candidatus Gottesmanbacteria bacterium]